MSLLVAQSVALSKDLHSPGTFFSLEEGGSSTRILPFSPRPRWGPARSLCLVPRRSPQRSGSCWNRLGTGRAGASGVTQKGIHKEPSSETPWAKKSVGSSNWGQLCHREKWAGLDLCLCLAGGRGLQGHPAPTGHLWKTGLWQEAATLLQSRVWSPWSSSGLMWVFREASSQPQSLAFWGCCRETDAAHGPAVDVASWLPVMPWALDKLPLFSVPQFPLFIVTLVYKGEGVRWGMISL